MTPEPSSPANLAEILAQVDQLKQAIHTMARADISALLIRIHKELYAKPECFGVLSDTEISTIIKGIEIHSTNEILVGKERPRAKKSFSIDDLDL